MNYVKHQIVLKDIKKKKRPLNVWKKRPHSWLERFIIVYKFIAIPALACGLDKWQIMVAKNKPKKSHKLL